MPEMVSDEYREGYAAFHCAVDINPYKDSHSQKWFDWEHGWLAAQLDWFELVDGEKSV